MENPPGAQPERDVVARVVAVRQEIAGLRRGHLDPRLLLLIGISRNEAADAAVRHVHEPGAVDAAFGHPAPEVGRSDVRPRHLERRALTIRSDLAGTVGERLLADPPRVVVRRHDAGPPLVALDYTQRLGPQCLRHLLGIVARLRADRRDLDRATHATSVGRTDPKGPVQKVVRRAAGTAADFPDRPLDRSQATPRLARHRGHATAKRSERSHTMATE